MTPISSNNLYGRPKLLNIANEKTVVGMFDGLTQAPSTLSITEAWQIDSHRAAWVAGSNPPLLQANVPYGFCNSFQAPN